MVVALQIKLTSALVVPAVGIELLLICGIWLPSRNTKEVGRVTPLLPVSQTHGSHGSHGVTSPTCRD